MKWGKLKKLLSSYNKLQGKGVEGLKGSEYINSGKLKMQEGRILISGLLASAKRGQLLSCIRNCPFFRGKLHRRLTPNNFLKHLSLMTQ